VVVWIEATRFQVEGVRLSPRGQREKPHEELVIAGFFALLQEGLGVIRVFDIRVPVVPSGMAGNELVTEIETQAIGIGFCSCSAMVSGTKPLDLNRSWSVVR